MGLSPSVWCRDLGAKWYPPEAEHFKEVSNAASYDRFQRLGRVQRFLGTLEQARIAQLRGDRGEVLARTLPLQRGDLGKQRCIILERCQSLEEQCQRFTFAQDLRRKVFNPAEPLDQTRSALGTNAGDSGIAIRRIADQRQIIGNSLWNDAEFRVHPCCISDDMTFSIDLNHAIAAYTLRKIFIRRPNANLLNTVIFCG